MKKIIRTFSKAFSTSDFGSSKSAWNYLKSTSYTPDKDKESIFLQDGELEIKYTKKAANKIVKEILHRHIDSIIQELTYPHSQIDEQAFNYFIKQDMRNNANHISYLLSNKSCSFIKQKSRSFATLSYKDHKLEKNFPLSLS